MAGLAYSQGMPFFPRKTKYPRSAIERFVSIIYPEKLNVSD